MGDDESSDSKKQSQDVTPYKFKQQKEEGIGKSAEKASSFVSTNGKMIAIAVGVLILIVVGSTLTGNFIKTDNELKTCQDNLADSYTHTSELSYNVSCLEGNLTAVSGNLSIISSENDKCKSDYNSCRDQKDDLAAQKMVATRDLDTTTKNLESTKRNLDSCNANFTSAQEELNKTHDSMQSLASELEKIQYQYALSQCCGLSAKYYTMAEGKVVCCTKNISDTYICGDFAVGFSSLPENQTVNKLVC